MQKEIDTDPNNTSFCRTPPILTIVAIEEPENHIAPHLLGKLVGNLQNIASKKNAQTIMTSHSPAIVKRVDPEHLRYFRIEKASQASKVRGITLPQKEKLEDQYKYIKEAVRAYPELYFAKLVILGEGDSEEIILPRYWEAINGSVDSAGISIVPLGGRHVNHFWRLLEDLQIPYITLLDLDRERDGGGWGRIKYVLKQLIDKGIDRNQLLQTDKGIMSDAELEQMSEWNNSEMKSMQDWIALLETYNVFFAAPLDVDFLMLETMGETYKQTLSCAEGPRIDIQQAETKVRMMVKDIESSGMSYKEYDNRIKHDIACTLKECGGDGTTYTPEQQKLMVWYNYFFLNRGKPSTHIAALSRLTSEELKTKIPDVLQRLITAAEAVFEGEAYEETTDQ